MYNILLVDSSDEMYRKIIEFDAPSIKNVFLAHDIEEIEQYIKTGSVDIIVSDLYLNEIELLPFFEQLRNSSYNLPVIIITADQSRDNVLKAASIGTMGYYLRPLPEKLLVSKIQTALDVYNEHHPSRNYVRIKPLADDKIDLLYRDPNTGEMHEAKLIDISLGGLAFMQSAEHFCPSIYKDATIDILLTLESHKLALRCEVVNIMDMRCNAKFVDLPQDYQEILSAYIYRRIGAR